MLEKELQIQQKSETLTPAPPTINHLPYLNNYQAPHLDPAILSQLHSNHQHRVQPNNRLDRRPMPPPGFSTPLHHSHQHHPMNQPHVDLYRGINGTKPFYLPNGSNVMPKLNEWPETLRNLVHDSSLHTQHSPVSSLHRQDKGNLNILLSEFIYEKIIFQVGIIPIILLIGQHLTRQSLALPGPIWASIFTLPRQCTIRFVY